ncbi:NYN domain-containing protein [Streptomyces sp. NBC_01233]|uniref:NYN domain-containing protein n=1 Tax=Streptomyces sp. NBC_01233 TaxID=2903787 RepID=UPI002E16606C|nr:NYN domain-containing protein [Streptomyces sp. NBC_01233]
MADPSWRCNFRALHGLLFPPTCAEGQAIMFGSYGEPGTAVWEQPAQYAGFTVDLLRRNAHNREKQVDSALTTMMLTDIRYMRPERGDIVTLVSGDSDFVRPVQALQGAGVRVRVRSWDHAASRELIATADEYMPLDPHFDELTYTA